MLEDLKCAECGNAYYGDIREERLCLDCAECPEDRNVSVFAVLTEDEDEFPLFATLDEALAAASERGLEDAAWRIAEEDAISHHVYDVRYRDARHEEAYRAAREAAARRSRT